MAAGAGNAPPTDSILCIGLFFDGTRNNVANLGQQRRPAAPRTPGIDAAVAVPYQSRITSSFDGGLTNVARLQRLYPDSRRGDSPAPALSVYIEGTGTRIGADDDLLGLAFGIGTTGVRAKINLALQDYLPTALRELSVLQKTGLRSVRVDLFGYSRGAAAARDAANQIAAWNAEYWRSLLEQAGLQVAADFTVGATPVRFIGLFDTVVAVSARQGDEVLHTALTGPVAEQVLHLVARDEHREHFALTRVGAPHEEIPLPGSHSDIGGGNTLTHEGPKLLIRPFTQRIRKPGITDFSVPPLEMLHASAPFVSATEAAVRWRNHLGLDDRQVRVEVWHQWQRQRQAGSASVLPTPTLHVSAGVVLEREIDLRYPLIPLRLMQQRAAQAGVAWTDSIETMPDYPLPLPLQPIAARLLAGTALSEEQEALLRRDYLMQSAHWNFDALGDTALRYAADGGASELPYRPGPGLFYINRPTRDGRREMLDPAPATRTG